MVFLLWMPLVAVEGPVKLRGEAGETPLFFPSIHISIR